MPIVPKQSRVIFQKLEEDLLKLSSKSQAKSVHRFRTGTRRLQILLDDLSPKLSHSDKKLLKALGKIRRRAGKVRDLDVQLAALRGLKIPREPRRKTQLVNLLIERRSQQEKKLRKEAGKRTVREILKRLKRAEKDFDPKKGHEPLEVAKAMLAKINPGSGPVSEAVLHQYRILSKRARYAAELAAPSPGSERFIAGIKRIQDVVGDWHDWLTLTKTASDNLGEVRESPLVAELHNVTGAKFRRAVAALSQIRVGSKPAVAQKPSAAAENLLFTSAA